MTFGGRDGEEASETLIVMERLSLIFQSFTGGTNVSLVSAMCKLHVEKKDTEVDILAWGLGSPTV